MSTLLTGRQRRQFVPIALIAAVAATALLSLSMTGAFSAFTASIANPTNSAGSGILAVSETQSATTCMSTLGTNIIDTANTNTCATDNYGAVVGLMPGVVVTQTVAIKNEGTTVANSLVLTPAACASATVATQSGGSNVCPKINITIDDTTSAKCALPAGASACAAPSSAHTLTNIVGANTLFTGPWAAGAIKTFTIKLQLDSTADNSVQNMKATQQLTWLLAA